MNLLLALATGHLLVFVFPDFGVALLAPFALAPLLVATAREPVWWKRVLLGEVAGFIQWIGCCYWIQPVLAAYGGVPAALSWVALLLFALVKGLHLAAFTALSGWVIHRAWALPALAALWAGIERTHGPLGFAWLTLGDAGSDMSVPLRLAPWTGVYGLSFVFALINAAVALLLLRRPRRDLACLLTLPLLYALPELPEPQPGVRRAVAIQPNLEESQPIDLDRLGNLTRIHSLNNPALVLWPELPAGMFWDEDPALRRSLENLARSLDAPFVFGAVTYNGTREPLNTALVLDGAARELGRYSKTYLVPFGEFVPPLFPWIGKVSDQAGDFVAGAGPAVIPSPAGRLGVFICYEAAFPHLVRQFSADGADVLVNLSNDGWFFRTSARRQHLALVRMRAAENRRWILRATNNGITASIDPAGRVMAQLDEFRETGGSLPYSTVTEITAYARYGDWFAWSCLALGLAAAAAGALYPQPPPQSPGAGLARYTRRMNAELESLFPKVIDDSRRSFLRVTALPVGFAAAVQPITAQTITTDTNGLVAGEVKVLSQGVPIPAYRAHPDRPGRFPVVLVVEEIFGLHEHIQDICRRFAKLGHYAIAPECFARIGDPTRYTDFQTLIREVVSKTADASVMADLDAAAAFAGQSGKGDLTRLGVTGFCWGGRITWLYAAHNPQLKAAAAWYGRLTGATTELQPKHPIDVVADLKAPVLGLYGAKDRGIPLESVEKMREALKAARHPSEILIYDADHGFHADYRPSYHKPSAEDAMARLLAWFKRYGAA